MIYRGSGSGSDFGKVSVPVPIPAPVPDPDNIYNIGHFKCFCRPQGLNICLKANWSITCSQLQKGVNFFKYKYPFWHSKQLDCSGADVRV